MESNTDYNRKAAEIMGLEVFTTRAGNHYVEPGHGTLSDTKWHPMTNIAQAMLCVEQARLKEVAAFDLSISFDGVYRAVFSLPVHPHRLIPYGKTDKTASAAIVKAFVAAFGG